jgi:hypothetical protein
MRKYLLAFAVAILLLPALSGGAIAVPAHQNSSAPVVVTLGGPSLVANASTSQYYLNLTGGPSGVSSFNYSYSAVIHAANVSGSSITPSTGSSHTGVFPVNITSTSSIGVMTVVVNASFASAGVTVNKSQSFIIRVVHPITITVPVRNNGNEGIHNVPISMYVDGVFKQSTTVSIPAHNEINVTFEWIAYTYSPGTHVVTLVIDYNGTLLFSNGARQTTINLYIPGSTFTVLDNLLTAGIIFAAIVFFMIFMRRPKPRT